MNGLMGPTESWTMTTEAPTEQISHIPKWCIDIFDEDQKDPDDHKGIRVIVKAWSEKDVLLYEDAFIYVGQEREVMRGRGCGAGCIGKVTAHWLGKEVVCGSDMIGQWIDKSSQVTMTISNLGYIQ